MAQSTDPVEIGFGVGAAVYQGDLCPSRWGSYQCPGFSLQAYGSYRLHPFFSARANVSVAAIHDSEQHYNGYHRYRNFSFSTTVSELSVQVLFHPLWSGDGAGKGRFTPYALGGVGIGFLQIRRQWSGFDRNFPWQHWVFTGLAADSATPLPRCAMTFPVGLGLQVRIGENVSLYAEGVHRIVKTEYLDGFSRAANPERNDAFSTISVGCVLHLRGVGRRQGVYDCPVNVY